MTRRLRGLLTRETLRYLVAGGATTLVNFALFALLRRVFNVEEHAANAASICAAVLFAYAVNKLYVFRSRVSGFGAHTMEFAKFVGGRAATMVLEYFGYIAAARLLGDLAAKASTQVFVFAANYAVSKLLVFRTKGENKGE